MNCPLERAQTLICRMLDDTLTEHIGLRHRPEGLLGAARTRNSQVLEAQDATNYGL